MENETADKKQDRTPKRVKQLGDVQIDLLKLAEPLILACTSEDGIFHRDSFIYLLSKIGNLVLDDAQVFIDVKHICTYGDIRRY